MRKKRKEPKRLQEDTYIKAKIIMGEALPELQRLFRLIPVMLHDDAREIIEDFEDALASAAEKTANGQRIWGL